ncbi:EEF1A N-terminal glycine/lysine methyltransferase [Microdochium nivale]|nr:EEF1A N-terminal glycine/lysine methyltransferase [Microdochium nivale]
MTATAPSTTPSPQSLRAALHRDGFVVIRSILSADKLRSLQEAADRTTRLARSGGWPHVRTVGKQFPPWTPFDAEKGIWGVQGLLNPALGPDSHVFARSYFCDEILDVAKVLMSQGHGDAADVTDDDLVMELYNMLVRPDHSSFSLSWHRDDIPPTATADEEMTRLGQPEWHTQWNLALIDGDDALVVVPGSHARARTEAERRCQQHTGTGSGEAMPGQLVVKLNAGDVVFYNNNILHRGVYESSRDRMSLHGSVGHVAGGKLRARNVLQHGVGEWIDQCDFRKAFSGDLAPQSEVSGEQSVSWAERQIKRAEKMRAKLVKLGRESGDVGYSLSG